MPGSLSNDPTILQEWTKPPMAFGNAKGLIITLPFPYSFSMTVKKLTRSQTNRMIAGVCGGIGEYLEVDPTVIRVIWVVLAIIYGLGILAYILAWLIIPLEESPRIESRTAESESPQKGEEKKPE